MRFSTIVTFVFFAATQGAVSSTKNVYKNQANDTDGKNHNNSRKIRGLRGGQKNGFEYRQDVADSSNSNTPGPLDCTMQLAETQFEHGGEEIHWECADEDGRLLEIDVPYTVDYKDPEAGLVESGVTRLHAEKALMSNDNNKVIFKSLPKLEKGTPNEQRRLLKTKGTRSVLVVRIEAKDVSTTPSEEDLAREVFGITDSTGAADTWNVRNAIDQCSYGKLKLEPAQNTGVNNGVYTVTIDQNAKGASNTDVRNAALNELRSHFGTNNLNALHDHFMLCMPPGTLTKQGYAGWSGFGIINGAVTMFNDSWCTKTSLQMHEIGHNLGLRHSGENGDEYADNSGMMGHSFNLDDAPVMCYNTVKNWQLGWYEDKHTTIKPLIQNFWEGEIIGYTSYQNTAAPSDSSVIVKVEGHNREYFIGFNHKAGLNRQNQEIDAANKITVHSIGTAADESSLEAKLGVGEHFEIPDFGGGTHSVIVQVINIDMSANPPIAKVSVNLMKCSSDSDCDDGSMCTTDTCNISTGVCHHEPNNLCNSFMKMVLLTDRYPSETSWKIVDNCNENTVVMARDDYSSPFKTYEDTTMLPKSKYTLEIEDAYGDGICCGQGNGSFQVLFNDEVVASGAKFGKTDSQTWGSCDGASDTPDAPAPTASPTASPTNSPSAAPTTCDMTYELRLKAGSSSSSGTSWNFVYDENRSRVLASSNGISYSPGSSHVAAGCLPMNCYMFQIQGQVQSYSLHVDGKKVAGKDDGTKETEISLFGKCSTM